MYNAKNISTLEILILLIQEIISKTKKNKLKNKCSCCSQRKHDLNIYNVYDCDLDFLQVKRSFWHNIIKVCIISDRQIAYGQPI